MNEIEKETLRVIMKNSGGNPKELDKIISPTLSYKDNKRIVRDHLKQDKLPIDLKTELVAENAMDEKLSEKFKEDAEKADKSKYDKVKEKKAEIVSDMDKRIKEVMKEVEDYNPHCSNITYSTLFAAMNAHLGKQKTHVINKGKMGIGKSRGTSELVKKLDIPEAKIIKGHMTPKELFNTLKRYRTGMIVLDESEMIMNEPQALFVLRSALYGGSVAWLTSKGEKADAFTFEGTLIANMNHFGVTEAEANPLFDRTLFNENNLDNMQTMEKIKSTTEYKPKDDIWKLLSDKITIRRAEGLAELSPDEEKMVMDFVEDIVKNASVFNKSISTRSIYRARLVAKCIKNLYGPLAGDTLELAKRLIRPYIVTSEVGDICVKLLKQNPNLTRLELTELIGDARQCSERQASRLVKAAIEKGAIVAVNRNVVRIA